MTYIPNQGLSKVPKILNVSIKQRKPNTFVITEQFKSLDLNSYSMSANGQQIVLNLKKDQEYLIETYSNEKTKIIDVISNDPDLVIKKNFNDLYRGYATFYLEKDTTITILRNSYTYAINVGGTAQSIMLADIIVYGVK